MAAPALVVFYVICAGAALIAGSEYALAALGAAVIPLTAAALLATTRAKTHGSDERRREVTADADADPFPGIGMDDATPLDDTSEHSDAERVAEPDRRFGRGARNAR